MSIFNQYPYIVIEGPIGSGKTTLARMLADKYPIDYLSEKAEANPFLSRFYQDAPRYALPTQLFFLFQRANQIKDLSQRDMFAKPIVADFFLEKDPLFARLNLDDEEYALYHQIYQHLHLTATKPDLVIYLQTPVDALVERVDERSVSYEQGMPREYLERLAAAYSSFFHNYDASPLLIVNNEKLNILKNESTAGNESPLDMLIKRIGEIKGQREYFNPNFD
jgi:deoxyadenosine/deoxycytidine kinase